MKKAIQLFITFLFLTQSVSYSQNKTGIQNSLGCTYNLITINNPYISVDGMTDTIYMNQGDSAKLIIHYMDYCQHFFTPMTLYKNGNNFTIINLSNYPAEKDSVYMKDEGTYQFYPSNHTPNLPSVSKIVIIYNNATGFKENNSQLGIKIHPNPTADLINISTKFDRNTNMTAEIFNIHGQAVYSLHLKIDSGEVQSKVDISTLNTGIYFLKIMADDKMQIIRLVKN